MAAILAQSISEHTLAYPTMATGTDDITEQSPPAPKASNKGRGKGKRKKEPPPDTAPTTEPQRTPTPYDNCIACKGNQSKYDLRHTRKPGECKWAHIETPTWTCPGCIAGEGRWTQNHNPGQCKHFDQQARVPHKETHSVSCTTSSKSHFRTNSRT